MMKHKPLVGGVLAVGLLLGYGLHGANAQVKSGKTPPMEGVLEPPGLFESAFANYVNVRSLATAIERLDGARMTDLAFQFAAAESALERQHKLFSVRDVAGFAAALAGETHDKASLERLAKLAAKLNDKELTARVAAAKLEAGKPPPPAPATPIQLDKVKPGTLARYKDFRWAIHAEKVLGNRAELERRLAAFEKLPDMPKELLKRGIADAQTALAAMPKDVPPTKAALTLQQLLDSRERFRTQQRVEEAPPTTSGPSEPAGLIDPAFSKFVTVRALAFALEKQDSGRLTDLAFQFAVGENALHRQHKLFSAREVAGFAAALAGETHDTASLDRLAKLAAKLNDKPLADKVAAAKIEASKPQTPNLVPADVKGSTLTAYRIFRRMVQTQKVLGNRAELERRLAAFEKQPDMPKELLDKGIRYAQDALAAIPKDTKPSSAALALQQLLDFREHLRIEQKKKS